MTFHFETDVQAQAAIDSLAASWDYDPAIQTDDKLTFCKKQLGAFCADRIREVQTKQAIFQAQAAAAAAVGAALTGVTVD